jgi:GTP cyclohydrolase I
MSEPPFDQFNPGGVSLEEQGEMAWVWLLHVMGLDPQKNEGLVETPRRAAAALRELTAGYDTDVPALFKTFEADGYDEMIVLRDIEFASLCEHHVLPFLARAHIAYVPNERVVGLSKLARLVDAFAHRLQIQERLTVQIADALEDNLSPRGVMVVIEATHSCMALRGVRKPGATMVTSAIRGVAWKPEARAEAMTLLMGGHR